MIQYLVATILGIVLGIGLGLSFSAYMERK